jgi:hypothetical protein
VVAEISFRPCVVHGHIDYMMCNMISFHGAITLKQIPQPKVLCIETELSLSARRSTRRMLKSFLGLNLGHVGFPGALDKSGKSDGKSGSFSLVGNGPGGAYSELLDRCAGCLK